MADSNKKSQITSAVDATGARKGFQEIQDAAAKTGAAVEQAGKQGASGLDKMAAGADGAATKIDQKSRSIAASLLRATAANEAGGRSTASYYEKIASLQGANLDFLKPYIDGLRKSEVAQKAAQGSLDKIGMSAAATTAALRQVPAQFTDIVTSLQGGQKPLSVLLQQGGQLKDMFGGAVPAAKAIGGYVVGLINPLTLAAAAAAGLAYAFEKGADEAEQFRRTVILTGGVAGVTADQLSSMAAAIGKLGSATQGRAAELLNDMAQSGAIGAANLQKFAAAALALERVGGPAAEQTVKTFRDLAAAPLEASLKLNQTTNFLTRSVYDQIRSLELQGKTFEAGKVAQEAYYQVATDRTAPLLQNLGLAERAWLGVKDAIKGAGDALLNIGRGKTLQEQLADAEQAVRQARARGNEPDRYDAGAERILPGGATALREAQQRVDTLKLQIAQEASIAAYKEQQAQRAQAVAAWDKDGLQYLTKQQQLQQAITRAQKEGTEAGASPKEISDRVKNIRERFDPGVQAAQSASNISAVQRQLSQLTGAYANAETILEAQRQAGLVDEATYYAKKRQFIRLNEEAEVDALQRQNQSLAKERQDPKLTTAQRIGIDDKVADNLVRIDQLQQKAATSAKVLGTQQKASVDAVSAAYIAARLAAEDFLTQQVRQHQVELGLYGAGTVARQDGQARAQIEDRYDQEARRIAAERDVLAAKQGGSLLPEQTRDFKAQLALVSEFKQKALSEWQDYHDIRLGLESDWSIGASEALANYASTSRDVAKLSEGLFTNAFSNMEDALVDFVKTGKLNFTNLANSIIADLLRIQIKQAIVSASTSEWGSAIIQGIGYLIGGGGVNMNSTPGDFSGANLPDDVPVRGGRAGGGPVSARGLYEVNERGPEVLNVAGRSYLMMGDQPGNVTPNDQVGAPAMNFTFNFGGGVQRSEIAAMLPELKRQVKAEVMASLTRPGSNVVRS